MGIFWRRRSQFLATMLAGLLLASCSTGGTLPGPGTAATPASTTPTSATPAPATPTAASTAAPSSAPPTRAAQVSPPASPDVTSALSLSPQSPGAAIGLPGVNDPACASQQRPVVLLHGTFSTVLSNFAVMTPVLQAAGRCVFGIDYGLGGLRPVRQSAASVTAFIDGVLAATGAEKVDVVAYSQGGLVLRTALRLDGLNGKVAVAVLIAPSFHGTTSTLLDALPAGACPGCADQAAGSELLTQLDAGGDLDGDVRYAVVSSLDDTVVTPVPSQVPAGPADRVRSIVIQDQCPGEIVDHISLPADRGVIDWTVAALTSGGAPDPTSLTCR